jgi:predicted phosphoribosyltransferase
MFTNRTDAGNQLAKKLAKYKNTDGVVMAIPRGGVPIGVVVASYLRLPLEVLLAKKIGHPLNPEFAIGAVSLTGTCIPANMTDITASYIESETKKIQAALKLKYQLFMGDQLPMDISNKVVILVDDGMATGNTLQACIDTVKINCPKKIIVAVPVASKNAIHTLAPLVDEVVCVLVPDLFYGVGQFYSDFSQVTDQEVIESLHTFRKKNMTDANE